MRTLIKRITASILILTILLLPAAPVQIFASENIVSSASETQPEEDLFRTTYEIFVYSFCDSDGDGIGDLNGVRSKLDYIEDLGFNQLWLMPVCPSPTYHKYDVTDYYAIDPVYGTMEDFEALVNDCHSRGIRILTDLVLNHTSSEHPWFQEAAAYLKELPDTEEPDPSVCPYVNYYHFSRDLSSGYAQLPDTSWYYEAQFWEGMPDLNLDNEEVRNEIGQIADFWLKKGVDGFRLDAVTSYYTGNDEKNIEFLSWLKSFAPYLVCEAWTDQNRYARYYSSGADSMFDFAFAGVEGIIAKTVKGSMGADRFVEALASEQELYVSENEHYVNAPFYTNHDLDRSTGYYAYDDGSRTKFALGLNLLVSGNAFLYYGDEIGMKGSGKDENKRAPMYWSAEADYGICAGPPEMDSFEQKFPPVSEQEVDPLSILNYVKAAISLRNQYKTIREGTVAPLPDLESASVGAYTKTAGNETLTILINTSEETQTVTLTEALMGLTLTDGLFVSGEQASLTDEVLTLPAFSVVILS